MELDNLQKIKRENGLYFLCKGEDIVYVGHSTNVYTRILEHIVEDKKTFDNVRSVYHEDILRSEIVEVMLISKLRPKYNKLIVPETKLFFYSIPNSISKLYDYEKLIVESETLIEKIKKAEKIIYIGGEI